MPVSANTPQAQRAVQEVAGFTPNDIPKVVPADADTMRNTVTNVRGNAEAEVTRRLETAKGRGMGEAVRAANQVLLRFFFRLSACLILWVGGKNGESDCAKMGKTTCSVGELCSVCVLLNTV